MTIQENDGHLTWQRDMGLLTILVTVFYLLSAVHPPIGSEVRYLLAGREMLASGDWIVPHLGGVAYAEKPIGVYWAAASAQAVFGNHPLALHLPAGFSFLVTVLLVYAWGRLWRGRLAGSLAAGVYMGCGLPLVMASTVTTDGLFAAALCGCWFAWWSKRYMWFWALLAVAWLIKGPLAVVLTGMGILPSLFISRNFVPLRSCRPLLGGLLFILILLPWHLAAWLEQPQILTYFYLHICLGGFYLPNVNHAHPTWYYILVLPAVVMPMGLVPLATLVGRWRSLATESSLLLVTCLFGGSLLFLSVSSSKLPTYILPIIAPLCIAAGGIWAEWRGDLPGWLRAVLRYQGLLLIVVGVSTIPVMILFPAVSTRLAHFTGNQILIWLAVSAVVLIGFSLLVAQRLWNRVPVWATSLPGIAAAMIVAIGYGHWDLWFPQANGAALAHAQKARMASGDLIVLHRSRIMDHAIRWELGRRLAILGSAKELGFGHAIEAGMAIPSNPDELTGDQNSGSEWLLSRTAFRAAWDSPRRCWLFTDEHGRNEIDGSMTSVEVARQGDAILLSNRGDQ